MSDDAILDMDHADEFKQEQDMDRVRESADPAGTGIAPDAGDVIQAADAPPVQSDAEAEDAPVGEDEPLPARASSAKKNALPPPVRRSFGRVQRIQPDAVAWVADFRHLGRDVLVRLRNPFQANPGHILEYELKRSAGGGDRWTGVDTVFNFQPGLAQVLALDEGRGLSPEGLAWLMRAIARQPQILGQVFGPAGSQRLQQQLLEAVDFPLPRALLLAALAHRGLASRAARRLLSGPLKHPEELARLLAAASPREEATLLERVAREHADWLLDPLSLSVSVAPERVARWWKQTGERRWLLQMPAQAIPAAAALPLVQAGVFSAGGKLPPAEAQAWDRHLDAAQRERLLKAAFQDPARAVLGDDPFDGLGVEFRQVLTALAADPRWGEEARARLLERSELNPAAALDLLRHGAQGEARARLITLLAAAPAGERPALDADLALECFLLGANAPGEVNSTALLDWTGGHSAVQERIDGWLADSGARALGLLALCHAHEFSRARVQRLVSMEMSSGTRARLVTAITRANPERWQDRYLTSEVERRAWLEAGAPLR